VDLIDIETYADELTGQLKATESAAEVRDLCFRLEGLQAAAQVKKIVAEGTAGLPFVPCGQRWSWLDNGLKHWEICTLPAGHDIGAHINHVTQVSSTGGLLEEPKPHAFLKGCCLEPKDSPIHREQIPVQDLSQKDPSFVSGDYIQPEPTKHVADRLHELVSSWISNAESFESVAMPGSGEEVRAEMYRICAITLQDLLQEGGI